MELIYHITKHGNFGDDLNEWLWEKYFPGLFDENTDVAFIGIGTLLGAGAISATPYAKKRVVFGSGAGYSKFNKLDDTWDIRFVRGPRTAKIFELDPSKAITDPAILTSQIVSPTQKQFKVSFIPHHASLLYGDWAEVCDYAEINFIDPRCNGRDVIEAINKSELVIAESMHGAIVADSLRVPWIPVKTDKYILEFKWYDWAESMNLDIDISHVPRVVRPITDYAMKKQIKNYTKIILQGMRLKKFDVILPIFGSSEAEKNQAANAIREIYRNNKRYLSKDSVFVDRLNAVLSEIGTFKLEYSQ